MNRSFLTKIMGLFFIGFLIFFLIGSDFAIKARMFSNNSEAAFCDGSTTNSVGLSLNSEDCPDGTNSVLLTQKADYTSYSIKELVIKSAICFLQGLSYVNVLSEKVELSDLERTDFSTLRDNTSQALNSIYEAWYYYGKLRAKASWTPYNQTVIKKLAAFDYDTFQDERGLIKEVFQEVQAYLIKGDVVGIYAQLTTDIEAIFTYLEEVQSYFYLGLLPPNDLMWDLNQKCAKTHLFGQYVARVFEEIN